MHDLILFVVFSKSHFTLGAIDVKNKAIWHFNSLAGGAPAHFFESVERWIENERPRSLPASEPFDFRRDWKRINAECPRQPDLDSCGVYALSCMGYLCLRESGELSRGQPIAWPFSGSMADACWMRTKLACELVSEICLCWTCGGVCEQVRSELGLEEEDSNILQWLHQPSTCAEVSDASWMANRLATKST